MLWSHLTFYLQSSFGENSQKKVGNYFHQENMFVFVQIINYYIHLLCKSIDCYLYDANIDF